MFTSLVRPQEGFGTVNHCSGKYTSFSPSSVEGMSLFVAEILCMIIQDKEFNLDVRDSFISYSKRLVLTWWDELQIGSKNITVMYLSK